MSIRNEIEHHQHKLSDINRIVLSMKAIASLNVQRAQTYIENLRVLNQQVTQSIGDILGHFPHLELNIDGQYRLCLAFGSDQGLCGTFNESILKTIQDISENQQDINFILIGKRLENELNLEKVINIFSTPLDISSLYTLVNELFEYLVEKIFLLKEVILVFNSFKGIGKYETRQINLMPIKFAPLKVQGFPPVMDIAPKELLSQLYIEYIYSSLYKAYLESFLAENGVRLLNMNNASQNLKNKLKELELEGHYYRQQEITDEIVEVLSNCQALE